MALKNRWKQTATGVGKRHTVSMTNVRNCVVSSISHTTANPATAHTSFEMQGDPLALYDSEQVHTECMPRIRVVQLALA